MTLTITQCCGVAAYSDEFDGGVYCPICDAEVDPQTGRVLTEREQRSNAR